MGEETVPKLGCTAGCKLIGANLATVGATDATGANTDIDGAAEAYTAGAAGEDDTTVCAYRLCQHDGGSYNSTCGYFLTENLVYNLLPDCQPLSYHNH